MWYAALLVTIVKPWVLVWYVRTFKFELQDVQQNFDNVEAYL